MPVIVRWWCAPEPPGSATAKPANSITTSEGIGMQAEPSAISRNTAGSPPSRTKCHVAVTIDSVTEARTSMGASTIPSTPMRVWIDLTNSPHVLVMRPVIELLEREGHEVRVTARDFAQTLGLLRRFEIPHTTIGRHRGE